jgi:formamidopyrimidine-DNA glycosylase
MRLHAPGAFHLPDLGPEPLGEAFTVQAFADTLGARRGPIKPVLLDQKVVSGVGNIYAAESLWVARIHPARVASSLSRARVTRLRDAIREVLSLAPSARYFAHPEEQTADDDVWRVYGREGEACTRCGGRIRRIVQAGRSTFYCGGCQR